MKILECLELGRQAPVKSFTPSLWHDHDMNDFLRNFAQLMARCYVSEPRLIRVPEDAPMASLCRTELRRAGVPVLEMNDAVPSEAVQWLAAAQAFSTEFFLPVIVFGGHSELSLMPFEASSMFAAQWHQVDDRAWLHTRQVALTAAVQTSPLNREFRRHRDRKGWIRLGWQPDDVIQEGNGLLLAWSSPLPLRRIRDFAARCPAITVIGPGAELIAQDVAAQGISVKGWRFAVK